MKRIRILLADLPPMLSDIASYLIRHENDMEIVADRVRRGALENEMRQVRPDIVIVTGDASNFPTVAYQLFMKYPDIKFLVLEDHGRKAFLYKLTPTKIPIGEVSPVGLIEAIRHAVNCIE